MRPRLVVVAALAVLAPLALPVAAHAGCGGVVYAKSGAKHSFRAPLFIGDSTGIFEVPLLAQRGWEANARGCRQMSEGLGLMAARKRAGTLPKLVAIHLGANWTVTQGQIGQALKIMGRRRVLALVTPLESGGGESSDAVNMRRAKQRHPKRIVLLDWVRRSRGHPEWFASDGLHQSSAGAQALTALIHRAYPYGLPRGAKRLKRL